MSDVFSDKARSLRALRALEQGGLAASEVYNIMRELDPVLLAIIFDYLRVNYPISHPQGKGVTERLVELTRIYSDLVGLAKKGQSDPIYEWFNDTFNMKDFRQKPEELLDLVINKLEG